MDFPAGIEGDYLETKETHLFFDIKGLLHPKDRKICFIRFYPDPEGDRVKDGVRYKKIYELDERYNFLRVKYPQYLFYSEQLGLEMQGVKTNEIKKIYTPRDYFQSLREKSKHAMIERASLELCELFIEQGGIPETAIGITGSVMIGLNKEQSDIDLIVYGTKESLEFQDNLIRILKSGVFCIQYNLEEYQSH
jgi:predicted nucleotidyltransferase